MTEEQSEARRAGLIHVSDDASGIERRRAGKRFFYRDADGHRVTYAETRARIRQLLIPPAYKGVWIFANPRGQLQAIGWDARTKAVSLATRRRFAASPASIRA